MKRKTEERKPLPFFVGMAVSHPKYGPGVVTSVKNKNSKYETSQFGSRYAAQLNVGVKFLLGGPQGWNQNSTHNLLDLVAA